MGAFVKVAKKSQIPEDTGFRVEVGGKEIALFKVAGKIYAICAVCPHQGGPLDEGGLHGDQVMCPWHGWEFSVTTGKCSFNDAFKLPVYKVREEGDNIFVEV